MNETKNDTHNLKTVATTAMVFGAAGYVVGVLSAPKSGRQTRDQLTAKGNEYKDRARAAAQEYKSKTSTKLEDAKQAVKSTVNRGKNEGADVLEGVAQSAKGT